MHIAATGEKQLEFHVDSLTGPLLARCTIKSTGGPDHFALQTCPTRGQTGVHALYMVFQHGGDAATAIDWFTFDRGDNSTRHNSPYLEQNKK